MYIVPVAQIDSRNHSSTVLLENKTRSQNSSFHYENMPIQLYWKFYHQKQKKNSDKNSDIFPISDQNIDWGCSLEPPRRGSKNIDWGYSLDPLRRGGTNEYPQSMFLSRNKRCNVYPCKPQCT